MSRSVDVSREREPLTLLLPFAGGAVAGLAIFLVVAAVIGGERESSSGRISLPAIVVEGTAKPVDAGISEQDRVGPVLSTGRPRAPRENAQGNAPTVNPRQEAPPSAPPSERPHTGGKYANAAAEPGQPIAKGSNPPGPVAKREGRRAGPSFGGLGAAGDTPLGYDVWAPLLDVTTGVWEGAEMDLGFAPIY
jgi:hypothetical protein